MARESECKNKPNRAKMEVGFKSVEFFTDQVLGTGTFGKVCKAKCDDLVCAAKMIHPTLIDPTVQSLQLVASISQEHHLPVTESFEQECGFLSTLKHPNIVQYIGMCRDLDSGQGLPVLLMELMDENLTQYLERCSEQPVPYHLQVNICHNVASALSYLHANKIVHRDICSNNILLAGNGQVTKLCDFGMTVFDISNRDVLTKCPGTDVYMPPEAVTDDPKYTEKLDVFSFGVVIVQVLTMKWPYPGNRMKYIDDPSAKYAIAVKIPEIERRQSHVNKVDPQHPLLPIALDCLEDKDVKRPTAHQLCDRIGGLKESPQYTESKPSLSMSHREITDLREQLQAERQRHQEEIDQIREEIKQKDMLVEEVFESARYQREQQLVQTQEEILVRRTEQENEKLKPSQGEHELRQQISDLQQQVYVEQQRASRER